MGDWGGWGGYGGGSRHFYHQPSLWSLLNFLWKENNYNNNNNKISIHVLLSQREFINPAVTDYYYHSLKQKQLRILRRS